MEIKTAEKRRITHLERVAILYIPFFGICPLLCVAFRWVEIIIAAAAKPVINVHIPMAKYLR